MGIAQSFIINAVISFFDAFTDPILLHIATHQGIAFIIVFLVTLLRFDCILITL